MTLSQALISIDKETTKRVCITKEYKQRDRSAIYRYSPSDFNTIFKDCHPLSKVLVFIDRGATVNIVVDARFSMNTAQTVLYEYRRLS